MKITTPHNRKIVQKKWGYEDWIWNEEYCQKILFIRKGESTSRHHHKVKNEVLYLQSGSAVIHLDEISVVMEPGMAVHVDVNEWHRIEAKEHSFIFEASTHHEDSDSHRE